MMCLSVVVLLVGMLAGIATGIQQNFALGPAHAHLNLVGGVLFTGWFRLPGPRPLPSCRAGST